tara:strand:+ start:358 stop:654 length:297 start_codon:yes stop_codon:yes gene_type:complete
MSFRLKYKKSDFPFRSPLQKDEKSIIVGPGAEIVNKIARDRMRNVEKETGHPSGWNQEDKDKNQEALTTIKQVRQSYPIHDSSNEEGEYEITARPDLK